jgi:TRAP-type C4-dicarboxylate transport system permease small subunit
MRRAFDWLERILKATAVVIVLLMLFALAAQVFLRYVFGKSLSWSEELALLGFAWVIVITTAIGIRRMSHARMDLIIEVLPKGLHQSVERFSAVLMLALGLFLTYAGWGYVAETRGSTSAAIGFPIELLYSCAPVFGVLVTLFSFERLMPWAESLNE